MPRNPRTLRVVLVGLVLTLLLGAAVGWAHLQSERREDALLISLAKELEATGLCANALQLLEAGDTAKLSALLEHRLDAALRQADRLVDGGARIGPDLPNLRESMARAAAHYERRSDAARRQLARQVLSKMTDGG